MKIFLHSLLALVLMVVLCSWNGDDKLTDLVKYMNTMCPYHFGESFTLEEVKYTNKDVTMTFSLHNSLSYDFDGIHANERTFRDNILAMLANNPDNSVQTFIEAIIDAKANLVLVIMNDKGDKHSMRFKNSDLKECMENTTKDVNVMLQSMIANTKLNLPAKVEEGITMTDVFLENGYCTYVYTCDESVVDVDLLQENDIMVKTMLKKELLETEDAVIKKTFEILKATNNGIACKYVGAISGKSCTFRIESDELLSVPEPDDGECKTVKEGTISVCVPRNLYAIQESGDNVGMIMVEEKTEEVLYVFVNIKDDWSAESVLNTFIFDSGDYDIVKRDPIANTTFMTYDARIVRFTFREEGEDCYAIALAFNDLNGEAYFISVFSVTVPTLDNSIVNSFRIIK